MRSREMTCRKDPSRVDVNGRAYAGSQRQIQTYVNEHSPALSRGIVECLSLKPTDVIQWVSPLRSDGYTEYRDADFLRVLGIAGLTIKLHEFWPRGGPCWDALARIDGDGRSGFILVEAKSHVKEIYGNGCGATGQSLLTIQTALDRSKRWFAVESGADWTGGLYQSANRYAHLYFLREIAGVQAHLVNVYFLDAPHSPTGLGEWEPAIERVQRELGIQDHVPFSGKLFLSAMA